MKPLTVGSLFAGIGGFDLGFENAGMKTSWQVEIEPFCLKVLAKRFPHAERFNDVRTVGTHNLNPVDVIVGGFPCQDVSVAGKRAGLAGERTGLFYDAARILQELRPRWFVIENVPGLLSSNRGRDFAEVLRVLMVECGYGVAWRVLNSQFFGVAQRRRRVFIVGYLGAPCPAEILFEPEGRCGDSETGEEESADLAAPLTKGSGVTGNAPGRRREDDVNIVRVHPALTMRDFRGVRMDVADPGFVVAATITSRHTPNGHGAAGPRCEDIPNLITTPLRASNRNKCQADGSDVPPLKAESGQTGKGDSSPLVSAATYPDRMRDFAGLPQGMDSARYRALGNAVTVNVSEWIARRIVKYEAQA